MKQAELLPRAGLLWIIAAQAMLLMPHVLRIPPWVILIYLIAFVWRVQAYRGRIELPGRWLKVALSGAAAGGIVLSFGTLLGMEPMVAFLLASFALKLTEMRSRKDAYVVLFLGYFVCLTAFLFTQDLLLMLYALLLVWVLTTALIWIHRSGGHWSDRGPPRQAALMLLQAFPLMLVLFFLVPRIGPLWAVPLKSQAAQTGMSDHLRPGDVSRLSQSDDVAFRVRFDGEIPPASELYWRGLVMSHFDGDSWRALRYYEVPPSNRFEGSLELSGESLSYRVLMEPSQQHWLYGLRYARSSDSGILHLGDYRLYSPVQIETEKLYSVQSWPELRLDERLSDWRRHAETALPEASNPRSRELAVSLRDAVDSDAAFVERLLDYFRDGDFRYTLRPPPLPADRAMDVFLFESRRGFCEHYAYAFTLMARAAGIPARIVGGYLGGEINPVNGTVIVHQFDAHAWAEVWLEGRGWLRVDPTAVVAPDRILYGLERAVAAEGSFLSNSPLSPLHFRGIDWVNYLRLRYDALTYRWQSWMNGFDGFAQHELLRGLLGEVTITRKLMLLLGSGATVLGVVYFLLLRGRPARQRPPFEAELLRLQDLLRQRGLETVPGETPAQLVARGAERWPQQAEQLSSIYRLLARLVYGRARPQKSQARVQRDLRRRLRRLQFSLPPWSGNGRGKGSA